MSAARYVIGTSQPTGRDSRQRRDQGNSNHVFHDGSVPPLHAPQTLYAAITMDEAN